MAKVRGGIRQTRPANTGISPSQEEDWRAVGDDVILRMNFNTIKPEAQAAADKLGLTAPETSMIHFYTGGLYSPLNAYLYGREDLTGGKAAERLLNTALSKLPDHKGWVYHGQDTKYLTTYLRQLEKYGTFESEAFVSATENRRIAEMFTTYGDPMLFKIKSKSGKKLGDLSIYNKGKNSEKEVTFRSKTKFKFLRQYKEGNVTIVEIEEL